MGATLKYIRIYEAMKAEIYKNYEIGSLLPKEEELMKKYDVSRTTLRHAVQLLKKEGIIEVKQGRGTYVLMQGESHKDGILFFHNVTDATHCFPEALDKKRTSVHGGFVEVIPAEQKMAKALEIPIGTPVYRIERLILLDSLPIILCRNYYRYDLFPDLDEYSGKIDYMIDLHGFFEWKYNVSVSKSQQIISAHAVSFFDAKMLDLETGEPVLLLVRTSHTGSTPFEYAEWLANSNLINVKVSMEGSRNSFHLPVSGK